MNKEYNFELDYYFQTIIVLIVSMTTTPENNFQYFYILVCITTYGAVLYWIQVYNIYIYTNTHTILLINRVYSY